MKIRIIFTTAFLIIVFLLEKITFAQEWQNNNLTVKFEQKIIIDIGITKEKLLLLCQDGLYFYDKNVLEKYQLDINSMGNLKKYKLDNTNFLNTFSNLYIFENKIWLIEKNLPYLTEILKDSVFRVKLLPDNYSNESSIHNTFYLDETGKLWVVRSKDYFLFSKTDTVLEKNKLYVLDDIIKEIQIPKSIKDNYIFNFFVVNNIKYFLFVEGEKLKLAIIENNNIEQLIIDSSKFALKYSCKFFKNTLYIVGNNGWIYIVKENEIIREKVEADFNFEFNIEIEDNNLFIPTFQGLFKYNAQTKKTSILSPEEFNENCFYGFYKVLKYFNSIIAVYGGPVKVTCKSDMYGLAIY